MSGLSRNQVRKAGKVLRRVASDDETLQRAEIENALEILTKYRSDHAPSLVKATMGLRSRVNTAGFPVIVSQRLKERATITGKLARFPRMQLTTMQDIAGCRAVLPTVEALHKVRHRWTTGAQSWRVQRMDDYVTDPKASGYRGIHLIVTYDEHVVEVQLRSELQHEWAYTVEMLGGVLGYQLKMGEGPTEVLELMAALADAMEEEEQNIAGSSTVSERLERARTAALPFLQLGGAQ